MFGIQFYPTPEALVDKMIDKVDWSAVTSILEPSAGKGDILAGIKRYNDYFELYYTFRVFDNITRKWKSIGTFLDRTDLCNFFKREYNIDISNMNDDDIWDWIEDNLDTDNLKYELEPHKSERRDKIKCSIECVEIDSDLCAVLRNKHYFTVNQDFLKYNTLKRYDCILMNPPFAQGEHHLLKALKLIENGGQCVCILNAETLKNPYTNWRQELLNLLSYYNADVEYISNAFTTAENTTDVEIALVYVNIPIKTVDENLVKNLVKGESYEKEYDEFNENQVATNDIIANLVKQYELEAKIGIKIIDDFYSMQKYIPRAKGRSDDIAMISLSVIGCSDEIQKDEKISPINSYIRALRDKYWSLLFMSNEIGKLLTDAARTRYMQKLVEFRDYDFTYSNIKQLQIDMINNLNRNVDEAILKQFDNFTYKYSLDKATNVHYFNGWRTNDAFMVRSKVIIPMYGIYTRYGSWSFYECRGYLEELEKCFTYLDGGKTDGDNVDKIIGGVSSREYNGERIHFKYFDIELKKKGTIHIWFTNDELLKKFNIFGCQKHGWLPNGYGKKSYKDMTKEEQDVIDSFEGESSYENVMSNPQVYLGGNQMLQLMG